MIRALSGDDLGVPRIPVALLVEWVEGGKRVVFSYARQGNGITIHLAAKRDSLYCLEAALNDFCEWLFWAYEWCEMIFGIIGRKSLERLAMKCGFVWLTRTPDYEIYVRMKP